MKNKSILSALFLTLTGTSGFSQIVVTNTQTPQELVMDVLTGSGVIISNVEFNYSIPLATSVQTMCGYFDATGTTFPLTEGVILASGNCALAVGPNSSGSATDNTGVAVDPNDLDLNAISAATVNNECILEFDFIPSGDSIVFRYVFGSEEYPEYVFGGFNDAFGFFISGPGFSGPYMGGAENIALVPGTSTPVSIDNVNNGYSGGAPCSETGPCANCAYYTCNAYGELAVEYDGLTTVMIASALVECGETYHIKLALGDAGDAAFDSGVFLEANSFNSNGISVEIASATGSAAITEGCDSAIVMFIRPSDEDTVDLDITYDIGGTATNGVDYPFLDGDITMPTGEDTIAFYITPTADATTEGTETVTISVSYLNSCGDSVTTTAVFDIIDPAPFSLIATDYPIDCPEDSISITVGTSGGVPAFTYDWSTGATTSSAWVPGDIVGTTSYTVDVTDACGESATATIDVTLTPAPVPTIVFNDDVHIVCPGLGADVTSTVVDPYTTPVTYDWSPTGETTSDIFATPSADGWYYLTIFDGCYTVTDSVQFIIGEVDITDIEVIDATDCPGSPTAIPGSIQIFPDNPTWTYEIITYVPPQNSGFFPGLDGGINYIVHVTDDNGCETDTVVYVGLGDNAIDADFILDSLRDITCFGDADGGAFVDNITGGTAPPYTVSWVHTTGVYDITPGVPVGGEDDIDDLIAGIWVVQIVDGDGCAWSYPFTIEEPEEFTLEIISNEPSCYGFNDGSVTADVNGGNGGNIFVIEDDAGNQLNIGNSNTANTLATGWYYITVTDDKGCEVTGAIFIDQPGMIDLDWTIGQPQCYGEESGIVTVDTVFNYSGAFDMISYYWNPNPTGTNGVGANVLNHLGEGDYTLTVNDENGCTMVFDFTITYPEEITFAELGVEPAYCRLFPFQSGNGVVYAAATGGTPDYTYEWTNMQTGATTDNTTWGGLNPGDYQIKITDDNGCILYQVVTLDSLNPEAAFTPYGPNFNINGEYCHGLVPLDVSFSNQSINFANPNDPLADTTFFWNFGTEGEDWQVNHNLSDILDTSYTKSGTYTVCLVAQNKNGCTDTACMDLIFCDPLIFEPVNIFTPDGDGINDIFTFEFVSQAVKQINVVIVDRWGVRMAEITDVHQGWNGTDKGGNKVTDGVYFYTYEGMADDGEVFSGQGNIHVVSGGGN
jgi:gliding motility-associated-like protein